MEALPALNPSPQLDPPYTPTIPAMLHALADLYGDGEAVVGRGDRVTFQSLARRSAELARGLLAQGIGKGSRIAVLMPNGPDFVLALMAAARVGALVSPLSTLYQAPELGWVLRHADIQMLLTSDRYLRHDYLERLERALPSLKGQTAGALVLAEAPYLRSILVWGDASDRAWALNGPKSLAESAEARPEMDDAFLAAIEANVTPADLFCIIHTSGSTAEPKGVVHSHGAMVRHSYQKSHGYWLLGEGDRDRVINTRPFFWVAGLTASLFHALMTGCCLIIPDDGEAATVLDLIQTEGATALCGAADWLRTLCKDPTLAAAGYRPFQLSTECAPIAVKTASGYRFLNERRASRTPNPEQPAWERFARSYGMTETLSAHTTLPSGALLPPERLHSCGRPIPGVILKVVDPETRQPLGVGEVGEFVAGGYSLMQGLYKKERQDVFTPDGLYATGDLGSIDSEGYVAFQSRMGEMIKVHGANVAPMEVELTLNALPQVERSAVVGLPSTDGGVVLAAGIQLRPAARFDETAIRAHLRDQLSSYKVPKRLFALTQSEFPVTGSGKVHKPSLITLLSEKMAASPAETQ